MLIASRWLSVVAFFLVFVLLAITPGTAAAADSVSRHFSSGSVLPGGRVNITLDVDLDPGSRFFVIDEIIPDGWKIIDNGQLVDSGILNASEGRHLKIIEFNSASDTSYTYQVKAPASAGTYSFSGMFVVDDMGSYVPIMGDRVFRVGSTTGDGDGSGSNFASGSGDLSQFCADGMITSGCICQGVIKDFGYCCDGYYQTAACDIDQGPLPLLEDCIEGETEQCGSNVGACSYGTRTCNSGVWSNCEGGIAPTQEYYDGIDNDCDGQSDEGCTAADISRCEADPTKCLCGPSGRSEASVQGNLPLYLAPDALSWVVVVITIIILIGTTKKAFSYRRSQWGLSGPSVPKPTMNKSQAENYSVLMALKGIIED